MKDEIKEILDKLKSLVYDEYCLEFSVDYIDRKEEKILLDHITNLQKEINKLTAESTEWESKYYDLQEENDYLKDIVSNTELSDEIKKADKWSKRELYKINYQRLLVNKRLREENERLKMNNGKASEMIKFIATERPLTMTELNKVYYILKGSDKDE